MTLSIPPRTAALLLCLWPTAVLGQQGATLADRHDFEARTARFDMPGRLDEISGLAVTPDGRIFAHDDERALVHEIDPGERVVGKRFSAGDPPISGDFEGIAVAGERFFLVTSDGILVELREVEDRREAPYRRSDTGLGRSCEIEGLDYDAADDALLFACKVSSPESGAVVVRRMPLDPTRGELSPILIPRSAIAAHGIDEAFQPSSIAVDPTGTLVLVSATVESLIEVDRGGNVLAGIRLSRDRHPQPEGLAFGSDGTLYIADEQNGQDARISAYARRAAGGS